LVGPVYAQVPTDLQLEFKWFFNEVLAPAPPTGGTSPAVPHWKLAIIRAIGNLLHVLMIFGVSYNVVTHASQHNPDGSHKTVQAEGSTRREDGSETKLETGDLKPDENRQPAGGNDDGRQDAPQGKPHRPSWVDEIKAVLSEIRAGVVGLAMGPPTARNSKSGNRKAEIEPVSDNEAVRVFALMKALDDGQRNRKAPLGRVFRLLVLEGLSQAATAKQCGCSPGLVSSRAAEIQRRMKRPVTELRALASRLGEMEVATADSRARKIYRRGLTDDAEAD
jgi:hypothetical protein